MDEPSRSIPTLEELELERQIMDPNVPKNEREHWAAAEIEALRGALTARYRELHDILVSRERRKSMVGLAAAAMAVFAVLLTLYRTVYP